MAYTITITISGAAGTTANLLNLTGAVWSGSDGNNEHSANTLYMAGGLITTSVNGDVVVELGGVAGTFSIQTFTASSGMTLGNSNTSGASAGEIQLADAFEIQSLAGSINPYIQISGGSGLTPFCAITAAFKASSGSALFSQKAKSGYSTSSLTISPLSAPAAGDLLLLGVGQDLVSGSGFTVSDSQGNAWTTLTEVNDNVNNLGVYLLYVLSALGPTVKIPGLLASLGAGSS
jgi:hypothetical protein